MILADVSLARRLEAAEAANGLECVAAQARLEPGSEAAALPIAGGFAIYIDPASALTEAIGLGLRGPVSESEIAELESFYRGRNAPVTVDLCPLCHPSLPDALAERGYRALEFNNVLVRELTGGQAEPDWRVRRAAPEEAERWAATVGHGFFERPQLPPGELQVGLTIFHMHSARCYLAEEAGEPAAGAALAIREGLALLFADSTTPPFRRRGLHTALIRARLHEAAARGCTLAAASTAPGSTSQANYERCGFQVAYTKVVLVG